MITTAARHAVAHGAEALLLRRRQDTGVGHFIGGNGGYLHVANPAVPLRSTVVEARA